MAKLQGYNHGINYLMDLELQELFYKRARAKYKVDLEIKCISPLLTANSEDADSLAFRVDNSIKEIESHMEYFNSAHTEYVKKVMENTKGDKEEMNFTIGKCNNYLK